MSSESGANFNMSSIVALVLFLFIGVALAKFIFSVAMKLLVWTLVGLVALIGIGVASRLLAGE